MNPRTILAERAYLSLDAETKALVQMDVEEQRTEDGTVDVMDGVLTMDLSNMMAMAQPQMTQAADEPMETMKDDGPRTSVSGTTGTTESVPMIMTESEQLVGDEPTEETPDAAQAVPAEKSGFTPCERRYRRAVSPTTSLPLPTLRTPAPPSPQSSSAIAANSLCATAPPLSETKRNGFAPTTVAPAARSRLTALSAARDSTPCSGSARAR